jgi:hypothetical protein
MARSKLTPQVHECIVECIKAGSYQVVAAHSAGIGMTTFRTWLERGEMEEARIAEGFDPNPDEAKFLQFKKDVEIARAQAEIESVEVVRQAGRNGTWQAAAWYLERSFPQRWSKTSFEEIVEEKKGADPDLALTKLLARLEALDSEHDG